MKVWLLHSNLLDIFSFQSAESDGHQKLRELYVFFSKQMAAADASGWDTTGVQPQQSFDLLTFFFC